MSNRLFQGVISQMHDVLGCELGVIDCDALIIACSDQSKVGCTNEFISLDLSETSDYFIRDGFTYMPFGPKPKNEYLRRARTKLRTSVRPCFASPCRTCSSFTMKNTTATTLSRMSFWTTSFPATYSSSRGSCTSIQTSQEWCS